MKNRFRILACCAALATVAACNHDEFLREVPSDFVAPENFYRNQGDALAAVNAAYATFINLSSPLSSNDYLGRNFWMVTEYSTEVVTSRLSATNERSLVDNYHTQFATTHPYIKGIWDAAYAGINRANSVIARVPAVPMDETRRDQIIGEAKFLRALHYYYLAGLFGGVPLKLDETKTIDNPPLPRATTAETWNQIFTDLTEAAAVLPTSWPTSDYGRVTKGAALALLGKAYLQSAATTATPAHYAEALAAFRLVTGYSLDPNYRSLFTGENGRSPEIIFSIQNIRVDGHGGRITEWFSPRTTPAVYAAGAQGQFQAERAFYDSYNATDVRKDGTWLTSFTKANGEVVTWRWTTTPPSIVSAGQYGETGPVPRKYIDWGAEGGAEGPDVILLRYADVLLSMAEAINEQGGPTLEAYGFVNAVRTRANVPNLTPNLSQAAFRDSLSLERRFELALEMHGLFDSRRNWTWAKARLAQSMTSISTKNAAPFTSSTTKFNAAPINDKWRLYPIPAGACELNELLVQNPGWQDGICEDPASAS